MSHFQRVCSLVVNIYFYQEWVTAIQIETLLASVMMDYAMAGLMGSFFFPLNCLLLVKLRLL